MRNTYSNSMGEHIALENENINFAPFLEFEKLSLDFSRRFKST